MPQKTHAHHSHNRKKLLTRTDSRYGLAGGEDGAPGAAWVGVPGETAETALPGKCSRYLSHGAVLRIETPGGGGWGKG